MGRSRLLYKYYSLSFHSGFNSS